MLGATHVLTSLLVLQQELPGPQAAIDSCILLPVDVQVIVPLPQVPPLLHFPNGVALAILHKDGAVDQVEGSPHPENHLTACHMEA